MKRRRAVRITLSPEREGGSGDHYRAGYQAGYALGLRLGQEDRGTVFEGTSIIIPVHPHHDHVIQAIQRVEMMTAHPYEVLIADAGATPNTRRYLHDRSGAIRHIKGKSGDSLAHVLNKAMSTSLGEHIAILVYEAPSRDNWLGMMRREFERDPAIKLVYASSSEGSLVASPEEREQSAQQAAWAGEKVHCLLLRRKLPAEIGLWEEGLISVEDNIRRWLERIPQEQRIRMEALELFSSSK